MGLTLVIMAAGMGSRYGGLKQIDPIGPNGEIILEYSIYDAIKAGFNKVVFVIREEMKSSFKEFIEEKIKGKIEIDYAIQSLNKMPEGFKIPEGREKPFGTGHAILCCKEKVKGTFAVINADDYYGYDSFKKIADFLSESTEENEFTMVGFKVENTLTEFGTVARGICHIDERGYLTSVKEYTEIKYIENRGVCYFKSNNWNEIKKNSIVSMNMWGFKKSIFKELEEEFKVFLNTMQDNPLKKEFYIPCVVDTLISLKKAEVKVLSSNEKWYGVTYKEDKEFVQHAIKTMVGKNYPENLWGEKNY